MNKAALSLGVALVSVFMNNAAWAQYCQFPPHALLDGPRRQYTGRYENGAYGYSVVIPDRLVGYDVVNPFYQHGFGIILGKKPYSYLSVDGSPNSLEFATPLDAAKASLQFLSEKAKVMTSETKPMQIGGVSAVFLVATYTCRGSKEPFVMGSAFVLSSKRGMVYELTLYAVADRYEGDRAVLDQIIKSWTYKR
jgi:hypothetical protein